MKLAWQQLPSPVVSELLCQNNFDGVVLDLEHSCFDYETLFSCIQVISLNNKKCFVRLTDIDKTKIRYCLDSGAHGLIFSTVEKLKQAKDARQFSSFPKWGGKRGLGLVRQNKWGKEDLLSEPPILIAQIETKEGIENLKEIADTSVFDYYMLGPFDLSSSVGIPGDFLHKDYVSAIKFFDSIIPPNKRSVHIPRDIEKELKKYSNYGIVALGMDTISILNFYQEL